MSNGTFAGRFNKKYEEKVNYSENLEILFQTTRQNDKKMLK